MFEGPGDGERSLLPAQQWHRLSPGPGLHLHRSQLGHIYLQICAVHHSPSE